MYDIDDAEAFVRATIRRSKIIVGRDEFEELLAEGLCILCEMAERYQPRMEGYEKDGTFAGYAARFLPKKLGEAWHKLHPEHVLRTCPDGSRRYEYLEPAGSLNQAIERDPSVLNSVRIPGEFVPPRLATGPASPA